ncbi:hypothetical protein SCLCIDRAFT_646807 [Scleroderma citrinum Foug A]|uniref:Uncharacterized protein n=1 Tax=Scleroderma citrinum Foug A TaxID=1036808 RepID=A0A0C2ZS33_9AGAM|nr:hypothetical protein SCLCIDRAFT_646807 [Scleroderma citrinum Foug A]
MEPTVFGATTVSAVIPSCPRVGVYPYIPGTGTVCAGKGTTVLKFWPTPSFQSLY